MSQMELNNLEQNALKELRERVKEEGLLEKYPQMNNDQFLLRWLIARDFHVSQAEEMLKKHLEWRKENDIDTILEWEPPADMVEAFPCELKGVDKQGRPIMCYGLWDIRPFLDAGREKEYIKFVYHMTEKMVATIKSPASQFVAVCDASKVTFAHMMHRKAMDVGLETMKAFEANYPELMFKCTVVNCPKIYYYIFALIKPLMSAHTLAKIELYDANREKWMKALMEGIDEDQLPSLVMTVDN